MLQSIELRLLALAGLPRSSRSKLFFATIIALATAIAIGFSGIGRAAVISEAATGCYANVGNNTSVTITKLSNGNCLLAFKNVGTTTWTVPAGVTTAEISVTGGGGGGGADGGSGGGGGGTRVFYPTLTPGSSATITVGAGGNSGIHTQGAQGIAPRAASAGGQSAVTIGASTWTGNGGGAGVGWTGITGGAGGTTSGPSGTGFNGGTGGSGLGSCDATVRVGGVGAASMEMAFAGMTNVNLGGGGGGGSAVAGASSTQNWGAAGGGTQGRASGGRGASYNINANDGAYSPSVAIAGTGTSGAYYSNGMNGFPNSGGGGGGGSACDSGGSNGYGQRTAGGFGAAGVVYVNYTPSYLANVTSVAGVVNNENFLTQPAVRLVNAAGTNVSSSGIAVTVASSGGTLSGTTTVNTDSSGIATFTNLKLTGLTLGTSYTLTFSSPEYLNVTQTFTAQKFPDTIYISNSATTSSCGGFVAGVFLANINGVCNINSTDLSTALTAGNVTLQAAGVSVSDNTVGGIRMDSSALISENSSSTRTLTLKLNNTFQLISGARIVSTAGALNFVVFANFDNSNGGAIKIDGNASTYAIETNGGHVFFGGGSGTTTWNSLTVPSGYASGIAGNSGTPPWWGLELGVNTDIAAQKLIKTSNGSFKALSISSAASGVSLLYGIAWESGIIDLGSGTLTLDGQTSGSPSVATNDNFGVGIGVNRSTSNDVPKLVTSQPVSISGSVGTAGTSLARGVWSMYADLDAGSSSITFSSTNSAVGTGTGNTVRSPLILTSDTTSPIVTTGSTFNSTLTMSAPSVSTSNAISAAGNVSLTATSGTATIGGDLASSGTGTSITLKATADVLQTSGTISTQGGTLMIWSDSDATSGGGIQTARGSSINTNGGALTMSGGTNTSTGYAKGTANTAFRGINIQGSISTGAGNVTMRGEDAATEAASNLAWAWGAGVMFTDDSSMTTTSGAISLTGLTNSDNTSVGHRHAGVMIGMEYFNGVQQTAYADAAITTGSGNITISGNGANVQYRDGVTFNKSSISSTSGSITIDGRTSRTDAWDINFGNSRNGSSISTGGAVTITGDTSGAASMFNTSSISAGGVLTLNVNKPTFTSMTMNGAGSKIIQHPTTATNFGAAVDITGISFASTSTTLTVGRAGVTPNQNVTLGNANTSIAGNITVYGAGITQSGAVVTTSGGNVTYSGAGAFSQAGALTSAGSITQTGGTTVSVTGATQAAGAISYSGSGAVSNGTNGTIQSTGSSVSLTSSASTMSLSKNVTAATSITISQTGAYSGAGALNAGTTLTISGGTTVDPTGNLSSVGNMIVSGSGRLTFNGITAAVSGTGSMTLSGGTLASTNGGLQFSAANAITTSGAILITGNASAAWGFYLGDTSKVQSTSGDITINGNAPSGVWGGYLHTVNILSDSGSILIDGKTSYGINAGYFATTNIGSVSPATSTSNVQVLANVYSDSNSSAVKYRTSGAVVIESTGPNFLAAPTINAHTFDGNANVRIGKLGNNSAVTVNGTATVTGNYTVNGAAITQNAPVTTTSGNITFTGGGAFSSTGALTAGGGLYITGATSLSSTAAWITNAALDVAASGNISTSNVAPITVNTGYLSLVSSGGTITIGDDLTAPGNVTLTGTSATISQPVSSSAGSVSITASTGSVSVAANVTSSTSLAISQATTYSGAGALSAGNTLTISGGTTVSPTGNLSSVGNMSISGSGRVTFNGITAAVSGSGGLTVNAGTLASTDGGLEIIGSNLTTTTGAINITANAVSSWGFYIRSNSKIQSTSGAITINGNAPSNVWGGYLAAADILSDSGAIKVDTKSSYGLVNGYTAITDFGALSPATSSSSVTLIGNYYWDGSTTVNVRTSGAVVIESTGTAFSSGSAITQHNFTGNSSLRIGKSTNNAPLTLTGSTSIAGNYDVYATAITQTAAVTTTNSGNITFTGAGAFANSGALNAGGGIYITGATTLSATGAWTANAALDVQASGNISTGSLSTITVNTGLVKLNSTAGTVVIGAALSAPGPITLLGNTVTANANVIATQPGQNILMKSKGSIIFADNITIQTAGGAAATIVLWTSSTGTAGGYVDINNRVCINTQGSCSSAANTGGADIIIGGGSAGTDYPTGSVIGGSTTSVQIGTGSLGVKKIYSAGGNISIKGTSSGGGHGLLMSAGVDVDSGVGAIELAGQTNATSGFGIYVCWVRSQGACNFTSSKTTGTAISFNGTSTGGPGTGWSPGIGGDNAGAGVMSTIKADGGGEIQLTGSSTHWDMILSSFNVFSTSGDIYYNAGNDGILFGHQGPQVTGGATSGDSTADVFITGDVYYDDVSSNTFNTTGTVTIAPFSDSFSTSYADVGTNTVFNGVTGFTWGKSSNTSAITFSMTPNIAGPIRIYAGDVTLNNGLTSTGANSSILVKASGNIVAAASTTYQTAGGKILLWANSDDTGTGYVRIAAGSTINSVGGATTRTSTGGGDIIIGGGSAVDLAGNPTGPALSGSSSFHGVGIGGGGSSSTLTSIYSGGGKISISGKTTSTLDGVGFDWQNRVWANGGQIKINGENSNATSGYAVVLQDGGQSTNPSEFFSSSNTSPAIEITALATGGAVGLDSGYYSTAANKIYLQATGTGGITLSGDADGQNRPEVGLNGTNLLSAGPITINTSSTTLSRGGFFHGGLYSGGSVGAVVVGYCATATCPLSQVTSSSANIVINTNRSASYNSTGATVAFNTAGTFTFQPTLSAGFLSSGLNTAGYSFSSDCTGVTFGKDQSTDTFALTTPATAISISGPIRLYAGSITTGANLSNTGNSAQILVKANSTATISSAITASGSGSNINIVADQVAITAAITAAGDIVSISPTSASKNIDLGAADSSTLLGLTDAELDYVTAGTLRIGDAVNAQNINVSASVSIASAKVSNLAIRGTGNVTTTNSANISAANLGISVGGTVSLPGNNSVTGNLAIAAAGATVSFGQNSGTYTPASVDGITADFGVPSAITMSQVPTSTPQDAFMAVAFNPPPVATVKDKFGNSLATANVNRSAYALVASIATRTTTSGTMTLAGTTKITASSGVATFSDLTVSGGTGTVTLAFTPVLATDAGNTSLFTAASTGTYNIQAGDPDHLIVKRSAAGFRAGIAFTTQPQIEIQTASNTVVTNNGTTLNVTASLSSGTGTLVGTKTVAAVNGVATFTDLAIEGSTQNTYGITFTATYSTNPAMTVSQNSISITFGTATKLALTTAASGFVNRANFTTQPVVTVQDAWNNTVTDWATNVVASISGVQASGLTGTTSVAVSNGVATFTNLGKTGKAELKTLAFSSGALAQTSQQFTLTHGAAAGIGVTTSAAGATVGVNLTTQPVVTIQDADGNTVNTGTQSTQNVVLSTSAGTTLTGTTTVAAINGVATYSGLRLNGTAGSATFTYTISSPSTITQTQAITLVAGTPTQLIITTSAAGCSARIACTTQPVIKIADESGNATTNTDTVTATITSGSGTVFAGATKAAVNGVATFSGFALSGTAGTFTIQFAISSPTLSVSQTGLTLTAGAATKLLIQTAAAGAVNRVAFTTQPSVFIADADGNKVSSATGSIAVSVSGGALGKSATLSGTSPVAASSGTSTFSGLTLTGGADTYTLTYSLSPYASVGQDITVTPGAASRLAIKEAATGFVNRADFTTQPQIEVQDADGNLVTNSTATVSVAISGGTIALSGTTTATAVNGVATFSGLGKYGTIATDKVLSFTSGVLTSASQTFTLTHGVATQVSVTRSAQGTSDAYYPSGPQVNVAVSTVTNGGWTECYRDTMATLGTTLEPAMKAACTGTYLMVAGRTTGSSTLTLAAAAPRSDVLYGTVGQGLRTANGSSWYYVTGSAMGFVNAGDAVTLSNCDTNSSGSNNKRLCIHLQGVGGYRIGTATGLNSSTAYERVFYQMSSLSIQGQIQNDQTFSTQPQVTIKDQDGNTVSTGSQSTQNVVASMPDGLSGTTSIAAVNGVATFTDLKYTGVIGSKTITYTIASPSTISTSESLTVTYGSASQLAITTNASNSASGVTFTTQPIVEVRDVSGNKVANSTLRVTASVNTGTLASSGNLYADASSGVATFAGLKLTGAIGTYTLSFSGTSVSNASQSITLSHGAPSYLTVTSSSSASVGVDLAQQPEVSIFDASGNLVNTGVGSTTTVSLSATGMTTKTASASAGVARFTGVQLNTTAGNITLTASITSPNSASGTKVVALTAGTPTQLIVTTSAANCSARIACTTQPVVKIADAAGNATTSTATVTATVTSGTGSVSAGSTSDAVGGVATFSGFALSGTAGTFSVQFAIASPSLSVSQTGLTLSAGTATKLLVQTQGSGAVNGVAFTTQPVVIIADADNNKVTSASGTITASIGMGITSKTASLGATTTASATSGQATFSGITLTGGADTYTITYTHPTYGTATQSVTLGVGAATQLAITTAADGAIIGANFATQPVLEVRDSGGNLVTTSSASVSVAATGATLVGTSSVSASNGVVRFAGLKLTGTAGTKTLTFTSTGLTQTSQSLQLILGTPSKLIISTSATGAVNRANFSTQPVIEVQDDYGNVVTTATDSVTVTISDATLTDSGSATVSKTINAVNGVATFSGLGAYGLVGSKTLTFSSGSLTGASQSITLTHGAATNLAMSTQASVANATAFDSQPVVTIRDQDNNTVTTGTSSTQLVTLSSSDATVGGTYSMNAVAGVANFSGKGVKLTAIVGSRHIVATISAPTTIVISNSVTITPGVATQLAIKTAASGFVNRATFTTQPEIEIQDISGNVVDSSSASVTASISGGTIALGGTVSVNAVNGVATFANLSKYGTVSGTKTLSFASNLLTGTSQTFSLVNGTPTQLAIISKPTTARSGQTIADSVIELRDQDGNPVITGAGATAPISVVAVKATETVARSLLGTSTVNAVAGRATFNDLALNEAVGTYNFAFSVPTPSVFASTIGVNFDFELTAGAAVDMRVTQNVSNVARNANMSPAVKVQLVDANGNDVLDDSLTQVSYQVLNSGGTALVSDSVARTAVNGEVSFSGVNLTLAPTDGLKLRFKIVGTSYTADSGSFNLLPGAVAEARITDQPSTLNAQSERTMAGELLKNQPVISLYDNGGYLVSNLNSGTVTVAISSGSGGTLNGSTSATISGGVATFAGVKLIGRPAGTGGAQAENYKLRFSYGAVSSSESNALSVTHNVAHHLTATRAPGVGQAGVPLGGADRPQVEIRDRYENLVNTGTQATELIHVDAAIASGSGSASLVGSTTISANGGVATFNIGVGGSINNTYSLTYSFINDSSVASATQTGVQVTAGDVAKLVITRQPATVANSVQNKTGETLKVQPILEFQDNYDNVVPVSYQVNAVIQGSPDLTKNYLINPIKSAVNGVVTYTSLGLVSAPGVAREITFYWNGVPTTNRTSSASLSVTHAEAHHLTIVTQPAATSGVRTGDVLSTQPKIEVRDSYENVVTSMTSGQYITAAVTTGGGSADTTDGVVRNNNTAEIINGVAQFNNLKIVAPPGVAQKLTFTGVTFTSAESEAFTVTYAAASKLAITQQPCSGAVSGGICANGPTGSTLVTQPVVAVQDRFGNLVANSTGAVTVSLTGAGGTLTNAVDSSGTAFTVNAVSGYATFANLVLTATPLANYQLNFASAGLTGIASGNVQVTHAAPTQLIMVSQPQGSATGSELSVQPVLRVADAYGNTATTDNSTVVTASTSSGVVRATVSSGVNRTASNGIVTFTDLTFNGTPQVNYSLNFNSPSLTGVTSANFTVTHAGLSKLVWRTQPVGAQTGENLATQPVLELQDFENNITTSDSATVVRVTVSGSGGSVTGSTTATAVNGVVTFAGLKLVGTPGVDYTLRVSTVSGPTIQSSVSQYVRVTHARPAQLSIQLPVISSHFISGTAPAEQPKIFVLDSYGNKATTDNSTVVTAFIASGVSGTVTGRTSATAVNGEVQFSGLQIAGTPGAAYTLGFSAVTSDSRTFSVNDVSANAFTMDKVADLTISYVDQAYVPSGESGNVVSVSRTTDSPGTITYSTTSASTICTVNSSTGAITIAGVGNCVVTASIAATADYRANTATDTFTISKAAQTAPVITSDDNVDFWQYLTPAATGGAAATSGFVWSVDGDCQLVGGKVWPGNAGNICDLFVFKRGNANYLTSPVTDMRITINKIGQQPLAIGNSNLVNVGDIDLFTTGGSGDGAVTYSVSSSNNTAGCTIESGSGGANVLHATANGSCRVAATKAASTNFLVALSPTKTFTFSKQDQTVAFTSTIPMAPVPLTSYTPTASASSGLATTIAITAGSGTVCAWDATVTTKINFLSTGVCDLTATQAGNALYNSATATQRITVGSLNQTITFASITDKTFGNPNFRLAATSNSGLTVTYRLGTNVSSQACTVSTAGLVTLTSAGFCEIVAEQAGNNIYLAAPPVTRMFQVAADFAGKPRVVSVSAGNQWFTATFTQPSYLGGSTVSDYILEVTNTNGDVYENAACGTAAVNGEITCTIVGIPNNVAYTARVAAITEAGVGLMSDSAGPLTPARQTQGVTNLAAVSSGSSLVVSYDAPLVTDSVVTGYQIYVAPVGGTFGSTPITTQNLSATIPVSSISSASVSSSSTNSATVRTASMRAASMRIASVPTSSPGASSSTSSSGYQVKVVTITQSAEALDPNDYITRGLHIGTTVPSAPRAITTALVAGSVSKSVFISWSTPISDGGLGISGYDVIVDGVTVCAATSSLTCELTNATDGRNYQVSVVAKNSVGASSAITAVHAMPALPVSSGGGTAPTPTIAPTPSPTQTVRPTPRPTQTVRPTTPPAPTQAPTAEPTTEPTTEPTAAPTSEPTAAPAPVDPTAPVEPGAPVPNPAIGATGDDDAPPAPFDPTGSPEAIAAAVDTATTAVTLAAAVAAAAAAAAAAAGAASAAAGGIGGSPAGGSSAAAGGGEAGRKPEEGDEGEGEEEPGELDVANDNITIERENWGDRLAMFAIPFITFFDRRSHNAAERIGNISPFFAKVINDGAYLRAMLGTISFTGPIAAMIIALAAVAENAAEIAAGDYSKIITPGWMFLLAIAALGAFDAAAGFVGAMTFIIGSLITVGHVPDSGEIRTMFGIMLISVGPAMLTTAFRSIRRQAAFNLNQWWERIADFIIAPFMAGWTASAMVAGLPALAGLTLDVANHVNDFAIFIALAVFIRVALEEFAARAFPARLNKINPDEIPDPSLIQKSIVLVIKYALWVFIGGALIGNSWQVFVGSALFVFPTVIGWFSDRFPNSPRIWRILPTGVPGLAFTLMVASATSAVVGAVLGNDPALGQWTFLILPLPMLVITALGWFGRHGEIDADGNEEERPGKRNKWIYRIGGIVVMILTLKLAGIF